MRRGDSMMSLTSRPCTLPAFVFVENTGARHGAPPHPATVVADARAPLHALRVAGLRNRGSDGPRPAPAGAGDVLASLPHVYSNRQRSSPQLSHVIWAGPGCVSSRPVPGASNVAR